MSYQKLLQFTLQVAVGTMCLKTTTTTMTPTVLATLFLTVAAMSTWVQDSFAFVPLHVPVAQQHRAYVRSREIPLSRRNLFDFLKQDDKEEKPTLEEEEVVEESSSSDDPVEKIFSFFFGAKEESPMGMKRFGRGE